MLLSLWCIGGKGARRLFFFFQAEDGIRDGRVTGVQTCALPICGYVLHYVNGSSEPPIRVVDAEGGYVRREPLIDDELWYKVQAALDACTKKLSGVRSKGSMLVQIAFCGYCGSPLYQNSARRSDGQGSNYYYLCP